MNKSEEPALDWLKSKQAKHASIWLAGGFTRLYNCIQLEFGPNRTVADVCRLSEADLLRTPNLGRKSLNFLKALLGEDGLRLDSDCALPETRDFRSVMIAKLEAELTEAVAERDQLRARIKAVHRALQSKPKV